MIRTLIAAVVLALAPGLAAAACFGDHGKEITMSCAEGKVWDPTTASCVDSTA